MSVYRPVDKVPDFPALERKILAFWKSEGIFGKIRERNAAGIPWSYLDGPITANNPMGVHHAWGRSYKDMFQRYHAMMGRALRHQNGFDCQGLWVEVEVEKELGFQSKADIVAYGIDKFVRKCKERVLTYAARQTAQSVRLGYFMDWDDPDTLLALRDAIRDGREQVTVTLASGRTVTDNPESIVAELGSPKNGGSYFTFSTENNTTIWSFLKKCHTEGFIYRGHDVMPWCFRCGTGLSHMEIADGRKITQHTSVFVRFPLKDRAGESLLVWTTTPWTLTSNVAAAVNPDLVYLKVKRGDEILIVSKGCYERDRLLELDAAGQHESHKLASVKTILGRGGELTVLGEVMGRDLVGLTYEGPFDHLPAQQNPQPDGGPPAASVHRVLAWEEVSEGEGTGIVHIAPGCGAEDHKLGRAEGLPSIAPLDENGRYLEGFGTLTGVHVLEVAETIVADLKERGRLVAKERYPHVYPHCWRCHQELVFRLVDEWFIRMDWRDRIQKAVPAVRWIPADGEAREQDWLKNMGDWMISKKRFYGLALPIFTCDSCGWFDVLGSLEELEERAVEGWDSFKGHTPHRPFIDAVKIRCGGCGSVAHRVPDVGNPWLDAGIVPFSTLRYNTDRDYWNTWFPADFVVESFPGQFRNWFYALLAMSAMMDGRAPFKVLLGHALVRDARGEEMHKSKGNSIAFDEAADIFGAEIMRYLYAAQNPVQNLNFPDLPKKGSAEQPSGKTTLDGEVRARLLTLWNCYAFLVTYASADNWRYPQSPTKPSERTELDRWILSRLQALVELAHRSFADYALYRLVSGLEAFTDELSNWWLRRSRRRFWGSEATADKAAAFETLYEIMQTLIRLVAPINPFLAEEMHQNLVRAAHTDAPLSVHLARYPEPDPSLRDEALEQRIGGLIRLKNIALSLRNQAKVRARQPLGRLSLRPGSTLERAILEDASLAEQILDECNVKALQILETTEGYARAEIKADFKKLGPRLGARMKAAAAAIAALDPAKAQQQLSEGALVLTIDGEELSFSQDEVTVRFIPADGLVVTADGGTFAALDTKITPELEREGIVRDFNRIAQDLRKDSGLAVTDRITLRYTASDRVAEAVREHTAWLSDELLAVRLERAETLGEGKAEGKAGSESVSIQVTRAP